MKVARLTVVLVLGAATVTALLATTAAGGTCWNYRATDRKMAKKINKSRSKNDKRRLTLDPHLSKVARRHTRSMAGSGNLVHTKNLGAKVTRWKTLGENVGYGGGIKQLHKLFMNSEAHRANIVKSGFRYVGVGTIRKKGFMWTTVVFEGKKNPGTTLPMPSC
jgi:uncharacterized protein YkwD